MKHHVLFFRSLGLGQKGRKGWSLRALRLMSAEFDFAANPSTPCRNVSKLSAALSQNETFVREMRESRSHLVSSAYGDRGTK